MTVKPVVSSARGVFAALLVAGLAVGCSSV